MDKIKKAIFFNIRMSICNFRCSYCYLAQRDEHYQGRQVEWSVKPAFFKKAFSRKRLGGQAYFNFCADGETLLVKDIDQYVKVLLEEGHYVEFITNASVTKVLDKFLAFDRALLSHLEFKCSFHYLELKKKGLLEEFAENVKKIWDSGASACIEITPTDDQIPFLDEIKEFSVNNFGALPHLTIARNDNTKKIDYLTNLSMADYDLIWSTFDSAFWRYKKSIFGKKQTGFCYAGQWSAYINIETGDMNQCYCGKVIGNAYESIDKPLPECPIGKCSLAHCYNGHAFLTLGLIPEILSANYGDIRDRTKKDGCHWLQREFKSFINTKLKDSNAELTDRDKKMILRKSNVNSLFLIPRRIVSKIVHSFRKKKLSQ